MVAFHEIENAFEIQFKKELFFFEKYQTKIKFFLEKRKEKSLWMCCALRGSFIRLDLFIKLLTAITNINKTKQQFLKR